MELQSKVLGSTKMQRYMQSTRPDLMINPYIEGIRPKGPYPPCLRMADRALLAGYPRYVTTKNSAWTPLIWMWWQQFSGFEFILVLGIHQWNMELQRTKGLSQADDMTWKSFPHQWHFVRGIQWIPLTKGPVIQSCDAFYHVSLTSCWTSTRVGPDLRCYGGNVTSLKNGNHKAIKI